MLRAAHRRLVGLGAVLALAAASSPPAARATAAAPATATLTAGPLTFSPSGIEGAGFVNVVVLDPRANGVALAGGDVSGIHRSTDGGRTWTPASDGLSTAAELKVAALAFSPTDPDTVFAALGSQGSGGGLAASTDNGRTWAFRSRVPQFSGGNNTVGGLPNPHPRSTGNLLAIDPAGEFLYAGTFDDGVMRSSDGGFTWTTLGLAGQYLRSLALDPADPDVLYAATYGSGVYRTDNASGTGAFTALAGSPPVVEELFVGGGAVYAAGGGGGVFRSADGGEAWVRLNTGGTGPVWVSIDGVERPGGLVLYAGADNPAATGSGGHISLMRSDNGGSTWSSVTTGTAVIHPGEVGGPGGHPWWFAALQPDNMLGGASYIASHLAVDRTDPDRLIVAGRSGLWGTTDGGGNWYPYVGDLEVTINREVVADPGIIGKVHVASSDWLVLTSTDGLGSVSSAAPPKGNVGLDIALDPTTTPARVYAAVGDADQNALGDVYSNPDPAKSSWTSEGLKKPAGGMRPLGVSVGRATGGGLVILAAVERSGIWRKAGGSWAKVNGVAMTARQPSRAASFSWPAGTASAYLYDNASGVWRSNDRGKTWTRIWSKPSIAGGVSQVAADPANPGRLFVAVAGDGVYRLDGATAGLVGSGLTPVRVGPFASPGPLAFAPDGSLYATETAAAGGAPALLRSADSGSTWTDLSSGSTLYRAAARLPFGLTVDSTGTVYLALQGIGALIGRPSS